MRSSVVDSCGDEAGVWLFTFKSLIMLPVQQHVGCTSTSSTGVPISHHVTCPAARRLHQHQQHRCANLSSCYLSSSTSAAPAPAAQVRRRRIL